MALRRFRMYRHETCVCGGAGGRRNRFFLLLFFLFSLTSCRDATVYHVYQVIPEDVGWKRGDSLAFHLPPGLSPASYVLEIGVRNTDMYPFRDLWLSVTRTSNDSVPCVADTLHLYLADEKGRWKKAGSAGGYYQNAFVCEKPFVVVSDSSAICLRVTHIMRENPLPGISDVGVRLLKK